MSNKKKGRKTMTNATKPTYPDILRRMQSDDSSAIEYGLQKATWSSPPVTMVEMADLTDRLHRLHEDARRLLERAEDNFQPGPIARIAPAFDSGDFGNSFADLPGTEYGVDVVTRSQALRALSEALDDEEGQGAA
jgi:hypothetical protein